LLPEEVGDIRKWLVERMDRRDKEPGAGRLFPV
jgi:hypothetical protein